MPVAIFLQIVVILTNVLISSGLGKPFENPQIPLIMPDPGDWGAMIGMFIATTIVAPVVEELTLRSVLYGWLRKHLSPMIAGMISAAAFAALHGSLVLLPGTFLVGLTLAWTYERSGSILPGMLVPWMLQRDLDASRLRGRHWASRLTRRSGPMVIQFIDVSVLARWTLCPAEPAMKS